MAAPKSVAPVAPSSSPAAGEPLVRVRAGMGAADLREIEAYTDEEHRRATELVTILGLSGEAARAATPALGPAVFRAAHQAMLRARALDAAAGELAAAGRIGSYQTSRGTEAAVVGAAAALEASDVIVPGPRQTGAALYRGWPAADAVAQLLGNAHDRARGRRIPGCPSVPRALNILPASAHAATQLPHAAGVAWAAKMQKKPTVALGFLDAIEVDAEDFHTALNFAAVFKLPVVFLCVDDRAPAGEHAAVRILSETIAVRALAYGIAGARVDGADLLAVAGAVRAAAARARRGEGATLIEAAVTGRGDPLERLRAWLSVEKILDAAAEADLRRTVAAEVRAALGAEDKVAAPPVRSLIENVWSTVPAALEDQLAELDRVRGRAAGG